MKNQGLFIDIYLHDTITDLHYVYHDKLNWKDAFLTHRGIEQHSFIYQYLEGNYSCDCNLIDFLNLKRKSKCGRSIKIEMIKNRNTGKVYYDLNHKNNETNI